MSDLQLTKRCSGPCDRELPATEEFFNKHSSGKYGLQPRCKNCKYEENRSFRLSHPERKAQWDRDYVKRNPDPHYRASLKYSRSDKGKMQLRKNRLETIYGITEEQYQEFWDKQNGLCAICGKPEPTTQRLHVDHDHKSNIVRGLLCGKCNRGIGMFEDSEDLLQQAIRYIKDAQQLVRIMD